MKQFFKIFLLFTLGFLPTISFWDVSRASIGIPKKKQKIKYQTTFGQCPSRSAGTLVLQLIKTFEEERSLGKIKDRLVKEKLLERHFISDYQINFDPLRGFLKFNFQCPTPLMKVQIYKKNGLDGYEAILVGNGKLFDPTYEVLLRAEKKLRQPLPYLAIPVGEMDVETQVRIAKIVREIPSLFRQKLSEVILNEKQELTIILSIKGSPSSVFLGDQNWEEKMGKLQRVVKFMQAKQKVPAIINFTNSEKVVVKFNGKL